VAGWRLVIDEVRHEQLMAHLFPGDDDEHGAVLAAGVATTERGTRLLVRDMFLAEDGVDFVPGIRGYRRLTAEFVRDKIWHCRDEGLAYLAVHNHGGSDRVGFSGPDNASHERGYPALLDISGNPAGALVFARNAVAADIWTIDGVRHPVDDVVVVGRNIRCFYPTPPAPPPAANEMYDRQVRWFGERGQARLARAKVGVIGAGGIGLPVVTMLARLGVGHIVAIDPDRVEPSNLPRLPDARRLDAMMRLRSIPGFGRVADRLSTRKVRLAKRSARRANPKVKFTGIMSNVIETRAAHELTDCDFIFLAADSYLARMVFNAVVHQYLVPGVQIGTRIDTDQATGEVTDIRSNVRLDLPHKGCLRCNRLISGAKIQQESLPRRERERNRYADELPAPSVITFNQQSAAQAVTDFLLMFGGLMADSAPLDYLRTRPLERRVEPVTGRSNQPDCRDCGTAKRSRRARGDSFPLPLPERRN
jgi:tRNA A37 threonylcarbamoyladenosine dehydratase